ncbi:PfkB family carbohydrate kinase [Acidithiobacillus sp. AMEEHan]|uniref:PfkB family carbohydrate kinase n=1 Tax=Acidithiobacillus sp. AMEEHan TaxID=2994951 RepID=UPI0035B0182D
MLDANGEALQRGIAAKPFLIKPNAHELRQLSGKSLSTREEMIAAARQVQQQGIDYVCVSLVARAPCSSAPSRASSPMRHASKSAPTVGAGDSMVAGLVAAFAQGNVRRKPCALPSPAVVRRRHSRAPAFFTTQRSRPTSAADRGGDLVP